MAAAVGAVRPDGTYVITGGVGALGLAAAGRLVARGARHLALVSRSGPGPAAEAAVADLRDRGVEVRVVAADVTDAASLDAALTAVRAAMPPLRGVVHAAGVLADATIDRMDRAQLRRALAPKVDGAWNLHVATADDPLDHFVLFSSVAGVLGLAGQANYAAGNAFLDALAHERRGTGRPATAIAWGPWAEIGLAASDANRGDRLAARGLGGLGTAEALDALDRALDGDRPDVVVMRFDAARWRDAEPAAAPFLAVLLAADPVAPTAGPALRERVGREPIGSRRRAVLEDAVCTELAAVLKVVADRIDRAQSLKAMGLDSLMALELRNRLEAETGLTLSATMAFNHPTVTALAEHLAAVLGISLVAGTQVPAAAVEAAVPSGPDDTGDASDDDLAALLRDELSAVERLLGSDGGS